MSNISKCHGVLRNAFSPDKEADPRLPYLFFLLVAVVCSSQDEENAKALKILPSLLQRVDAIADPKERVEFLIKGMLAGNVFDLGASNVSTTTLSLHTPCVHPTIGLLLAPPSLSFQWLEVCPIGMFNPGGPLPSPGMSVEPPSFRKLCRRSTCSRRAS